MYLTDTSVSVSVSPVVKCLLGILGKFMISVSDIMIRIKEDIIGQDQSAKSTNLTKTHPLFLYFWFHSHSKWGSVKEDGL